MRPPSRQLRPWLLGLAVVVLGILLAPGDLTDQASPEGGRAPRSATGPVHPGPSTAQTTSAVRAPDAAGSDCDFRDEPKLLDHHARHGAEFGSRTPSEYLAVACQLRDAPLSRDVLELRRPDGVLCRFRRSDGAFLAYRPEGTILTCFKPERGERYFRDQLEREAR
ncbi:MAG: hypothetical protein ACK57N_11050 [Planctomycetia bacterium]|jgi:hypothetical protein